MDRADVVVIGGGIIGSAIAFQLAARGGGRVVLLERGAGPSEGSPGASSSIVRTLYSRPETVRLAVHSQAAYLTGPSEHRLFEDSNVRPSTHLNAVGAFTPRMVEISPATVQRAFVEVDDRGAAAREAGDFLQAGKTPDATLGDLLTGIVEPPSDAVTMFKSVGIASLDVAAAMAALDRAAHFGLGVDLPS